MRHPDTFYEFYWESMVRKKAKPNKAHIALANFEKAGHHICIVTQNIDGLHQEAGSKLVLEVHGSTKRYFCPVCGKRYSLDELTPKGVPHCSCGSILKPDVVLYGEPLDDDVLSKAVAATMHANVMIIGGTSLNVYPAAGLVQYVPYQVPIYLIDPEEVRTGGSRPVTFIQEGASEGMHQLFDQLVREI